MFLLLHQTRRTFILIHDSESQGRQINVLKPAQFLPMLCWYKFYLFWLKWIYTKEMLRKVPLIRPPLGSEKKWSKHRDGLNIATQLHALRWFRLGG